MWIKTKDKIYNTDYFSEIWQEGTCVDNDLPPQPMVYARTEKLPMVKLSSEPVLQEIIYALQSGANYLEVN